MKPPKNEGLYLARTYPRTFEYRYWNGYFWAQGSWIAEEAVRLQHMRGPQNVTQWKNLPPIEEVE